MILPFTASTYVEIAKAWRFPPLVMCAIRQPYSLTCLFEPTATPQGSILASTPSRGTGILLRFDSHWECESTIVVTQHPQTGQITIMAAGFTASIINRFTDRIRAAAVHTPSLLANPLFAPVLWLSELAQNQTDWLELIAPDLNEIQQTLGMANWKYAPDSPLYGPNVVENLIRLDLAGIMSRLSRMADSVRFQRQIARTLIGTIEELEGWLVEGMTKMKTRRDEHESRNENGNENENNENETEKEKYMANMAAAEDIKQTLMLLSKSLKGCQSRVSYRGETIQGIMDTVSVADLALALPHTHPSPQCCT